MRTSDIRDAMLRQKTIHEQSLAAAEKAMQEMREKFAEINDDDVEMLASKYGIDLHWIKTIDYERLRNDEEYYSVITEKQELAITQLHKMLEEALDNV